LPISLKTLVRGCSGFVNFRSMIRSVDNTRPVLVIYTSGTTGLPKGVPCTHLKMIGAGAVVQGTVRLKKEDRGYICMPLFHSNAWYVGVLSIMIAGASFVLKRKFSASAFESDILEHGVTFMNYVGQPLHYILTALEKKYGSVEDVEAALAHHSKNRFRIAYGNGATCGLTVTMTTTRPPARSSATTAIFTPGTWVTFAWSTTGAISILTAAPMTGPARTGRTFPLKARPSMPPKFPVWPWPWPMARPARCRMKK